MSNEKETVNGIVSEDATVENNAAAEEVTEVPETAAEAV